MAKRESGNVLIVYNGGQVYSLTDEHGKTHKIQAGENLIPASVWDRYEQRTGIKHCVVQGTMINRGPVADGYVPKGPAALEAQAAEAKAEEYADTLAKKRAKRGRKSSDG